MITAPLECSFSPFCTHAVDLSADQFLGLTSSGDLIHLSLSAGRHTIATKANSFVTTPSFIIVTTVLHQALFIPLPLPPMKEKEEWEQRRVERGSKIITVVASNTSLVIQMPRGNLETIYPRPLVTRNVEKDVTAFVNPSTTHSALY
jgi:elongator complex protein 1